MATLNPNILLAQQQYKVPDFSMGETLTNIAKMKAYQQAQRLEELKLGQAERTLRRDEDFQALASQLFTQDTPAAQPPARGLAGGPAAVTAGPPPPAPPAPGGLAAQGPGPWVGGYQMPGEPPGGLAMAQPGMPPAGAPPPGMGGMPPGIPAPTSMEPGTFTMAQGGPQPPAGLAGGQPAAPIAPSAGQPPPSPPAPPEPPAGLGGAQPGQPQSLVPQMNERVMAQMYARDPVKAAQVIGGQLDLQSKKLEQTEKTNELIFQGLSALQSSPNPAEYYPVMLQGLREKGVQIPASFPKEYQPGLMAFKLKEHETLKSRLEAAKVIVEQERAAHLKQQQKTEQAQQGLHGATTRLREAETGAVPSLIKERQATTDLQRARAGAVPSEIAENKAQTAQHEAATNKLIDERKAKAGQITEYTSDSKKNVYLSQAAQELKLPPGTPPTPEVIARARQYEVEDEQNVVRKTGLDAVAKNLTGVDKVRVEGLTEKGSVSEGLMNTVDEIERLIGEGVYTNIPEERLKRILADAGLRASDPIAARTARLYELGNAMALEKAGGKLGGQVSDTDLRVIQSAGGNFQSAKSALAMQESLKSIKKIARIHLDDANNGLQQYKDTQTLPRFGQAREERLKILTPRLLKEAYEARKKDGWTEAQIREGFLAQGYREE